MAARSSRHQEPFGPTTDDTLRRVDHLRHRVAELCGDLDAPAAAREPAEALDGLHSRLARSLRGPEPGWSARELQRAVVLLGEIDETALALSDAVAREELADVGSARRVAADLRDLPLDLAVQRAPVALAEELELGRVMISTVHGLVWTPRRLHIRADQRQHADAFHAFVENRRIRLTPTLLETALARAPRSALVRDPLDDGRTYQPIIRVSRTPAYVVAPIVVGRRVAGLLHADRLDHGDQVAERDRRRLESFATAFGVAHESRVLRERLAATSGRLSVAAREINAALERLEGWDDPLDDRRPGPGARAAAATRPLGRSGAERRLRTLTRREHEILVLIADGRSNQAIADAFVVSPGTVKTHVHHVLEKLGVSSRAAAAAVLHRSRRG